MIPEIKHILYATDLSDNAAHAFGYAASLANRYEAKISVMHVIEELSASSNIQLAEMLGEAKWKEIQDQNTQNVLETITRRLELFCKEMAETMNECPFLVTDKIVRQGNPVEWILQEAEDRNSDLIVLGSHGQSFVADIMLGSTARRVVRRSTVPVLTIRLPLP